MLSNTRFATRVDRRLVLLAPPGQPFPSMSGVDTMSGEDHPYLEALQRLRAREYVRDGVVLPGELTADGRHVQAADASSWHILCTDSTGAVHGCVRYRLHARNAKYQDLGVAHSPLGTSVRWESRLRAAVTQELAIARRRRLAYVEVGAWAVSEHLRHSSEAVRMVMAVYGLARAMGGALGITTATTRHNSALILHRLGGEPLDLPTYYDPRYRSEMKVLRFDSSSPNQKYLNAIEAFQSTLIRTPFMTPPVAVSMPELAVAASA
jgi:hypothetical protein